MDGRQMLKPPETIISLTSFYPHDAGEPLIVCAPVHSRGSSTHRGCAETHVRGIKVCCRTRKLSKCTNKSVEDLRRRYMHVYGLVRCFLRWLRACRGVWTGRCRSGSCLRWGSAAWPASSPDRRSGSASCTGSARPAFAAGGGTGSSPLSPRWRQRRGDFSIASPHT